MLVLSRKKNESIVINDDITIVVVEIRGDKVRLGVEAPKEVPVHRNEVYEAIRPTPRRSNFTRHDAARSIWRAPCIALLTSKSPAILVGLFFDVERAQGGWCRMVRL